MGWVIDETTSEQAIALPGKPTSDFKSGYLEFQIERLLSIETREFGIGQGDLSDAVGIDGVVFGECGRIDSVLIINC